MPLQLGLSLYSCPQSRFGLFEGSGGPSWFTNNDVLGVILGAVVARDSGNVVMYSDLEEFDGNLVFYRSTDLQRWIY
jgi:hypothetical protein